MRLGIIDLGTNSVRFDVHQVLPRKRAISPLRLGPNANGPLGPKKSRKIRPSVKLLHREKWMVRLGQDVFTTGKLHPDAIKRTLQAFKSFQITINDLHVDRIIAFGTSALREASDGQTLIDQLETMTGVRIRIISGTEEAKLIARGILAHEDTPSQAFALVDIGGGSTEISICKKNNILYSASFPLGTARLQQMFLKKVPAHNDTKESLIPLRRYIRSILLTKLLSEEWPKVKLVLGSSGTVKAIARLRPEKNLKKPFSRNQLERIVKTIAKLSASELLDLEGMEAKRVDMIVPGAVLLEEAVKALGADNIRFTEYSLRDGILEEEVTRVRERVESQLSLHLDDLRKRVTAIHKHPEHSLQVEQNAISLFNLLQPIHKLSGTWRPYLQAAALFHDMGELISSTNHEEHSYYFAKKSNIIALEPWESEWIARMCLYHRAGKVVSKGLKDESAFKILVSLLRMADSLDRSHEGHLQITKFVKTGSRLSREYLLWLKSPRSVDLELLRFSQKKALFEELLGVQINVKYRRGKA